MGILFSALCFLALAIFGLSQLIDGFSEADGAQALGGFCCLIVGAFGVLAMWTLTATP